MCWTALHTSHSMMLLFPDTISLLLLLLALAGLLLLSKGRSRPPGLPRLPLLGSVPWILWKGKHVMDLVREDRRKHGALSSVGFGPLDIIFINDPWLLRQVLGKEEAAGRLNQGLGLQMKSGGVRLGLIDPDSSCPAWKEQKRFVMRGLRDRGFGSRSEAAVQEEALHLVEHLLVGGEKEVIIKDQFNIPVVNVIWKMIASKTFPLESDEGMAFMHLMDELFNKRLSPLALIPVLGRLLCFGQIRRRFQMFREMRGLFEAEIEEHERSLEEAEPRDLIDQYLVEVRAGREGFTKEQLTIIILDLFAAGSETSSTTLRWAILYLVLHPQVGPGAALNTKLLTETRTTL